MRLRVKARVVPECGHASLLCGSAESDDELRRFADLSVGLRSGRLVDRQRKKGAAIPERVEERLSTESN